MLGAHLAFSDLIIMSFPVFGCFTIFQITFKVFVLYSIEVLVQEYESDTGAPPDASKVEE